MWLCCRGIKVTQIVLYSLSSIDHSKVYNDLKLISIRSLGFCKYKRHENIDVLHIINNCSNLQELYFMNCSCISDNLIERILCFDQLKSLNINTCSKYLTPLMLKHLALHCRNLDRFRVNFNTKVSEFFCSTCVYSDYFASLLKHNKQLNSIVFEIDEVPREYCESVVDLLDIILTNCPKLKHCILKCIGSLNVLTFARFCLNSKFLIYFHVIKSDYQLNRSIWYLNRSSNNKSITCNNFYSLKSVDKDENNIEHLFKVLTKFTHITLNRIWYLCDNLLFTIADNNLLTLTELTIDKCLCACWSNRGIENVLTRCKRLTRLTLFDCSHLLEEDFSIIAHVVNDSLTSLTIEYAIHLNTASLVMLINNSKQLVYLHVKTCSNLNKHDIHEYCRLYKPSLRFISESTSWHD